MNNQVSPHPEKVLQDAARQFFYKPYIAFFRAFELRAYHCVNTRLEAPAVDLGCGDGGFGDVLRTSLGQSTCFRGFDTCPRALQSAEKNHRQSYQELNTASATNLPLEDGEVRTLVANGLLEAVQPGLQEAIVEIGRILHKEGTFYCTVPTDRFGYEAFGTTFWTRLGFSSRADSYRNKLNRRMTNFNLLTREEWEKCLTEAGLHVERVVGFFPASLERTWSLLTWTPLRIFSASRLIPLASLHQLLAKMLYRMFLSEFSRTPVDADPATCSYILLVVRKTS